MIDYFHLEKYGVTAVNYNRDLETFPVLKEILHRIVGHDIYYSPTDMGVNVIKDCIVDDEGCKKAACDEVIRRYFKTLVDVKKGLVSSEAPQRVKLLMNELGLSVDDREVVKEAEKKKKKSGCPSAAIMIGKKIVVGRQTDLLSPISATFLNAIKVLTKIPDDVLLISPNVLEPILDIKRRVSNFYERTLKLDEVLIALSICSATNPVVKEALDKLENLKDSQLHATYLIPDNEMIVLNNLGINATCDVEANL